MNYNLTPKQKELIKDIVEEVRDGNLEEVLTVVWLPGGVVYLGTEYRGARDVIKKMRMSDLYALEKEDLLHIIPTEHGAFCYPSEYGYQAVDSDFGALIIPSTATSGIAVQVNDIVLVQLLKKHFDLEGLDELCFYMRIEPENVKGNTLSSKCRNLVRYMAQHNQLMTLIITAVKERPNVDWSSLY